MHFRRLYSPVDFARSCAMRDKWGIPDAGSCRRDVDDEAAGGESVNVAREDGEKGELSRHKMQADARTDGSHVGRCSALTSHLHPGHGIRPGLSASEHSARGSKVRSDCPCCTPNSSATARGTMTATLRDMRGSPRSERHLGRCLVS